MTTALLILILSFLLPLLILRRTFHERAKQNRLNKYGVQAQAMILNLKHTGTDINRLSRVKLQVQVYPRNGRNFVTELSIALNTVHLNQLRTGTTLRIRYNPANTREVRLILPDTIILPEKPYYP